MGLNLMLDLWLFMIIDVHNMHKKDEASEKGQTKNMPIHWQVHWYTWDIDRYLIFNAQSTKYLRGLRMNILECLQRFYTYNKDPVHFEGWLVGGWRGDHALVVSCRLFISLLCCRFSCNGQNSVRSAYMCTVLCKLLLHRKQNPNCIRMMQLGLGVLSASVKWSSLRTSLYSFKCVCTYKWQVFFQRNRSRCLSLVNIVAYWSLKGFW